MGTSAGVGNNSTTGGQGTAGSVSPSGGSVVNPTGGSNPGTAGTGTGGSNPATGSKNLTITGSWPDQGSAITQAQGKLTYKKVTLHTRFLAESCSIADYNNDGEPDVSAGRRWYQGPFTDAAGTALPVVEHIFRGGHDDLPRQGINVAGTGDEELVTGVSDDWACYPFDMDGDGNMDIINIASCDVDEKRTPSPSPTPQVHATAYWYKNPGPAAAVTDAMWQPYLIHSDVRLEQHGLLDIDKDGYPEIYGACKGCNQAKGYYYQPNKATPTSPWMFRAATRTYEFPFNGTGWLHGLGFGDVDGDMKPDLLERAGYWTNADAPAADMAKFKEIQLYGGGTGGELGGSHMYTADIDGDMDMDIIGADFAHRTGISWWEQTAPGTFTKHKFVGGPDEKAMYGGIGFSQPHALQVVDMDGDGVKDIVTGKMRFAHPDGFGDPDLQGEPVSYVFKVIRNMPSNAGSVTFQAFPIDTSTGPIGMATGKVGVGRQLAVGHANKDGIMDMCTANKLGLFVFLGQ